MVSSDEHGDPDEARPAVFDEAESDRWDRHSAWWQEHFTGGADPEYEEQILPLAERWLGGCRRVVEVGTGEGQVARRLAGAGVGTVVGVDLSTLQLAAARSRGGGPVFARGSVEAIPVRTGWADGALACLVFEHVEAVDEAIAEVARVLAPGGRFAFFLNHPLLQTPDSGWIDDQILDPPEQYWRVGAYLREQMTIELMDQGIDIRFVHRPLSRYVNTLLANGLVLEHMDEPAPPAGFLARAPEYAQAADIPRLLLLVCRRS